MLNEKLAAEAAAKAAETGYRAMKVQVGHVDVATDLTIIRAVRGTAGDAMAIMVDSNRSLSVPEAVARTRLLDEEGLHWIEEPHLAVVTNASAFSPEAQTLANASNVNLVGRERLVECPSAHFRNS